MCICFSMPVFEDKGQRCSRVSLRLVFTVFTRHTRNCTLAGLHTHTNTDSAFMPSIHCQDCWLMHCEEKENMGKELERTRGEKSKPNCEGRRVRHRHGGGRWGRRAWKIDKYRKMKGRWVKEEMERRDRYEKRQMIAANDVLASITDTLKCNSHVEEWMELTFTAP